MREYNRMELNLNEMNLVTGGVTYDYSWFSVVIPDDENEPYETGVRMFTSCLIAKAKQQGATKERILELLEDGSEATRAKFDYYWDKTFLN